MNDMANSEKPLHCKVVLHISKFSVDPVIKSFITQRKKGITTKRLCQPTGASAVFEMDTVPPQTLLPRCPPRYFCKQLLSVSSSSIQPHSVLLSSVG